MQGRRDAIVERKKAMNERRVTETEGTDLEALITFAEGGGELVPGELIPDGDGGTAVGPRRWDDGADVASGASGEGGWLDCAAPAGGGTTLRTAGAIEWGVGV